MSTTGLLSSSRLAKMHVAGVSADLTKQHSKRSTTGPLRQFQSHLDAHRLAPGVMAGCRQFTTLRSGLAWRYTITSEFVISATMRRLSLNLLSSSTRIAISVTQTNRAKPPANPGSDDERSSKAGMKKRPASLAFTYVDQPDSRQRRVSRARLASATKSNTSRPMDSRGRSLLTARFRLRALLASTHDTRERR